jgi:bifunctional UDP-N-acetylglucosamine pyrophosphorylase/glucosamine-1-phosphate N-acetyltransferase
MIILAAGKGTRMGGDVPKPLVKLGGKPLIQPIIENALSIEFADRFIAISDYTAEITRVFSDSKLSYIETETKGTGYAALKCLEQVQTPNVLITQADDSYFYTKETLLNIMHYHGETNSDFTYGLVRITEQSSYSYITTTSQADMLEIKNSPEDILKPPPKDVICGMYAAKTDWLLQRLKELKPESNGEFGLPWVGKLPSAKTSILKTFLIPTEQWQGVNNRQELEIASNMLKNTSN